MKSDNRPSDSADRNAVAATAVPPPPITTKTNINIQFHSGNQHASPADLLSMKTFDIESTADH